MRDSATNRPGVVTAERRLVVAVAAWAGVAGWGLVSLSRHAATPGPPPRAAAAWPGSGVLPLSPGRRTLVLFVHPDCPCSYASVVELSALMADCGDRVRVTVVATGRDELADPADVGDVCRAARRLAGVAVVGDAGGSIRRRFGAATSGTAYVYADDGRLLYVGGLTGARGHTGDNDGRDAATAAAVAARPAGVARRPVFGCGLATAATDRKGP